MRIRSLAACLKKINFLDQKRKIRFLCILAYYLTERASAFVARM